MDAVAVVTVAGGAMRVVEPVAFRQMANEGDETTARDSHPARGASASGGIVSWPRLRPRQGERRVGVPFARGHQIGRRRGDSRAPAPRRPGHTRRGTMRTSARRRRRPTRKNLPNLLPTVTRTSGHDRVGLKILGNGVRARHRARTVCTVHQAIEELVVRRCIEDVRRLQIRRHNVDDAGDRDRPRVLSLHDTRRNMPCTRSHPGPRQCAHPRSPDRAAAPARPDGRHGRRRQTENRRRYRAGFQLDASRACRRSRAPRSCGRATTATHQASQPPLSCLDWPSQAPTGCAPSRTTRERFTQVVARRHREWLSPPSSCAADRPR